MERVIKRLVEYDKAGRKIVQRAQDQRKDVLEHMDDYKKALAKEYSEHAQGRIAIFTQEALSERADKLAQVYARHQEQMGKLRHSFEENSKQWIEQIVTRCIGG